MIMTTHYRFEEVKACRTVKTFCRKCKKKLKRSGTEWSTLNPFNKNPDGSLRTREQVWRDVDAKIQKWADDLEKNGTVCGECQD